MIRVMLPQHLRTLAQVSQEVELPLEGAKTINSVVEELLIQYPMLRGTIAAPAARK